MKKIGTFVIIAGLIIVAIVFALRGVGILGRREDPAVWEQMVRAINVDTLEIVEVTTGDWHNRFKTCSETGYKIDDEGGKIAVPRTCPQCGESIPPAPEPDGTTAEEAIELMAEFLCPSCGRLAYPDIM